MTFSLEWEPADGVSHPAQARTWARIEIRLGTGCATTVHDKRTGGTRAAVYGPAFLLAEWIVRNFWFVLWESAPADAPGPAWSRRHSLVSAREGTSLPDLVWFRDEDKIIAKWRADNQRGDRPVAFVESGQGEFDPGHVRTTLTNVVDLVLERLHGSTHPDVEALRADWEAITSAKGEEAVLCKRAARMGLDAYDEHEVSDDLVQLLTTSADRLPELTRDDLLDAAVAHSRLSPTMGAVAGTVRGQGSAPPRLGSGVPRGFAQAKVGGAAYQQGYALARLLRMQTSQPADTYIDMDALLATIGWRSFYEREESWTGLDRSLKGIVGISQAGLPRLVAPPRKSRHERFLVARSMYALLSGATATAPRLLTGAGTRLQTASRAFAAELLAPADAIRARIRGGDDVRDPEIVDELADELDVAPYVIEHQIENQLPQHAPAA